MSVLQNFGSYCAALGKDDKSGRYANMILFTRDWLIDFQSLDEGKDEVKLGYVSNYEIFFGHCPKNSDTKKKDELTRIVGIADGACRHIAANFRNKILRENVLMPSYQARELGSAGLSWLSKHSGRNIREKLAYTGNKLLAVKRRLSLDTGENRLFKAFIRRIVEFIDLKGNNATQIEKRFGEWGRKLVRDEDLAEIGRWENTAPNNTLLSDKNYRTVWRAWQALEKIDDMIAYDVENLVSHICTVFYWKLLSTLTLYCRFCVQPVPYDYAKFDISPHFGNHVVGLSNKGYISFDKAYSDITIKTDKLALKITFSDLDVAFIVDEREVSRMEISPQHFDDIVKSSVEILFSSHEKLPFGERMPVVTSNICVYLDVFATHPRYLIENNAGGLLTKRVVWQTFGEKYELSADEATALYISSEEKLHSVRSVLMSKSKSTQYLPDLIRIISGQIKSPQLAVPLPDFYSVFQLAPLRQALRMHYDNLIFVPQSITVLMYAMSHKLLSQIQAGDFVLVADYMYGQIAITMLQSKYVDVIEQGLPDTLGLTWERHPTVILPVPTQDSGVPESVISVFGEDGLKDEENLLAFDLISHWSIMDSDKVASLHRLKYDITSSVENFITAHKDMLGEHRVYGLIVSSLLYADNGIAVNVPKDATLKGFCVLNAWENSLKEYEVARGEEIPPLWSEHLPALAIKRLYGAFSLIGENDKVEPLLDKPQRIHVPGTFTLPRRKKEYHFSLIMGNDKDISYEAALRHRSFPLKDDVECELNLTYTYGRDNPYELVFVPKNKSEQFAQIKATWEPVSEYPYNDLPYPKFPLPSNSWEELQNNKFFSKKQKRMVDSNFLEWVDSKVRNIFTPYEIFDRRKILAHKKYNGKNDIVNIFKIILDGKPAVIKVEGDLEVIFSSTDNMISCKLSPVRKQRYITTISKDEWFCPRNGNWMCIKKGLNIDGEIKDVAFFPNQFIFEEDFFVDSMRVSFYAWTKNDGKTNASNILVEGAEGTRFYRAFPDSFISGIHCYNLRTDIFYPLHHIYANGVTSTTPGCPASFKETVQRLRDNLLPAFHNSWAHHDYGSMVLFFRIMCIMAKDIGQEAYEQISNVLTYHPNIVDEDCGCALGDYDQSCEQMVLNAILGAKLPDVTVIGILSKAAWKSDGFIPNMSAEILLDYYRRASDYLEKCEKKAGRLEKPVLWCFEYILAVFRLRKRKDATINWQLSLNDSSTEKLVGAIEDFVEAGSYLPSSRVKIALGKANEEYKNIPRLMYAILVYINDDTDDITITGISEEDE